MVFILFGCSNTKAQSSIDLVKIYCIEWNSFPVTPSTCDNIKSQRNFFLEISETDLDYMFANYDDCSNKLDSREVNLINDSTKSNISVNNLVELVFKDKRTISVCFDENGNYLFKNKWHNKHDGFYYSIFKYFSSTVISPIVLENAKKNTKDYFW